MELLGAANWWLPKWLVCVLPHLDLEGSSAVVAAPAGADAKHLQVTGASVGTPSAGPTADAPTDLADAASSATD
jgi:hypothetical protein